ncbi:hypothetical protein [Henriciella pelagia]|jgi:hypothetical protein|uniref:DUF3089 domain-containing protein n=1 Tax=Henriciella pelagia TaxID=1977912 RepID=A0ABQ1J387_9PROT|nr:hypothetical protein [Henriciella pelagia]GGB58976.1 hypothetical protein GCM10011503_04230 [Henriciella pelagia]
MRRGLIAILVVLVGWFVFKDLIYTSFIGRSDTIPPAPDFFYDDVWLERPSEDTDGGWVTPWGVDLFVVAPPSFHPAPAGLVAADAPDIHDSFKSFLSETGLQHSDLSLYAPSFRSPSPALTGKPRIEAINTSKTDIQDGFTRYLTVDNRDRGVVILIAPGAEEFVPAVVAALPSDDIFRERFGGIIVPASSAIESLDESVGACSNAFEACVLKVELGSEPSRKRWILPSLPHPKRTFIAGDSFIPALESRAAVLSEWLDANAVKPAEPFDSWAADEVVDVAPIRRPNQDEDISGDRGN